MDVLDENVSGMDFIDKSEDFGEEITWVVFSLSGSVIVRAKWRTGRSSTKDITLSSEDSSINISDIIGPNWGIL